MGFPSWPERIGDGLRTALRPAVEASRSIRHLHRRAPKRIGWSTVAIATIVPLSGLGAFSVTRARFAPAVVRSEPAVLTVQTRPDGADLLIDGRYRGTTPATLSLEPGPHVLAVRRAGTERTVQVVANSRAELTHYFDLPAADPGPGPGSLSIVTDPPGARVSVDGQPRGVSPVVVGVLAAAPHTVTVRTDAGSSERLVTIERGTTKEVVFSLPRPSPAEGGWVAIAAPFPVDLLEHGEVLGTSEAAKLMLPAGRHDVVVRNEKLGYEDTRRIDVVAGKLLTLSVVAPTGALDVNARPWAEILIDGASVGETPMAAVRLAIGTHEITFRHPDLGERRQTVVITAKGPNRASVDLTR